MDIGSFPHQVTRLVFDTGQPYEELRARYENAVPELDSSRLAGTAMAPDADDPFGRTCRAPPASAALGR